MLNVLFYYYIQPLNPPLNLLPRGDFGWSSLYNIVTALDRGGLPRLNSSERQTIQLIFDEAKPLQNKQKLPKQTQLTERKIDEKMANRRRG